MQIEHARCKWIVQCYGDASNYGLPTPRKDKDNAQNSGTPGGIALLVTQMLAQLGAQSPLD